MLLQYNSTYCCVIKIQMSYGKSVIHVKTRNLLNIPCINGVSLFFSFFFFAEKNWFSVYFSMKRILFIDQ